MWSKTIAALAICQFLSPIAVQAATWPSPVDEIEDLMYLQSGRNAQLFGKPVTPSTQSIQNFTLSAGFLRIAFHDMGAYNKAAGTGGLDASLGFELGDPYNVHNAGPAFNATLNFYYDYFNSKASMADLIALGTYASVRAAGGPQIAMRAGRIDATGPGDNALPDAADNTSTLVGRFKRMGFNASEMVQMVACGHTLGGLHPNVNSANANPQLNGVNYQPFDTTDGGFDNKVASQYVDGSTKNPLVVGPNKKLLSDLHTFVADGNATIKALAKSNIAFNGACQNILQKMIECVPKGVTLSDVITPYQARPYLLNLNVVENGAAMIFSGEIRIRGSASSATITYKGASGDACTNCTIKTTFVGTGKGFDDTFSFFGFSARVTSISSFTVTAGGQTYTNGGNGFPVNDNGFVMMNSSSLSQGTFKPVIAVRTGKGSPTLTLNSKTPRKFNSLPTIQKINIPLTKICGDDKWTYYQGSTTVTTLQINTGKLDLAVGGTVTDGFRGLRNFQSSGKTPTCGGRTSTTTTQSSTKSSTSTKTSTSLTTTTKASSLTTTTKSKTSASTPTSTSKSSAGTTTGRTTVNAELTSLTTSKLTTGDITTTTSDSTTSDSTTSDSTTSDTTTSDSTTSDESGSTTASTDDAAITSTTTAGYGGDGDSSSTTDGEDWSTTTTDGWSDIPTTYPLPEWNNYTPAPSVGEVYTSIYEHHYNDPAPSGGSNGGEKNMEGVDVNIVVIIVTPVFAAPTAVGDYQPGQIVYTPAPSSWAPVQWEPEQTSADYPAATASTWGPANVPVSPSEASETWGPAGAPASPVSPSQGSATWAPVYGGKPSATWTGGIAKYTGAANALVARGETVMMGVAAVAGAMAYLL